MTTWTDVNPGTATYRQDLDQTVWDDGDTLWDVPGTVALTYWDVPAPQAWTDADNPSTPWTDA
jgi:hypothetical protein